MNSRVFFALFCVFIVSAPLLVISQDPWGCPYSYQCGRKRQASDESTAPQARLMDRLRSLRESRPKTVREEDGKWSSNNGKSPMERIN